MKTETILIDDESGGRETVARFVNKYIPEITIVAEGDSVKKGLELILEHRPQLLLLDISMQDGTAFDLLQKLPERNFEVIFITAYEKYAVDAFKYSAVDFLLKPVEPEHLRGAVLRAIEKIHLRQFRDQWDVLVHNLQEKNNLNKQLAISTSNGFEFVNVGEIARCESSSNYTTIYKMNGKKVMTSKHLGHYEELLPADTFCRIHHSHLINLKYVDKYIKGRGGSVIMKDGIELEVSQRKRDEFLEKVIKIS